MAFLQQILLRGNLQTGRSFSTSFIRLVKRQDGSSSSSSDSDSSSDDEKSLKKTIPPEQTQKNDSAMKLNALLNAMIQEDKSELKEDVKLNLAKPREKQRKTDLEEREKKDRKKFGEKLVNAAKEAAEEIGGDVKQTEVELLTRLLYKSKQTQEEAELKVSSSDKKDTKKSLGSFTLNELLSDMKIDRTQPKTDVIQLQSRAEQVRNILGKSSRRAIESTDIRTSRMLPSQTRQQVTGERVNLFGAEPLGIFKQTNLSQKKDDSRLEMWERCFNRELKLAVTQPPTNIYEQMILWTEKGMLWHFPIDNEQGLEEEKKINFYEHVHLERHIEDWCPDKGPIRHFMELVCVGLSKNPWLTVDEKLQHIWWFRDFFRSKAATIKEIGAGEIKLESTKEATA